MKGFNKKWTFRMAAAFLVWSVSSASPAAAAEKVSVAYCTDCVPFQFKDDGGQAAGLIIDLWRLWSEKTGITIDFQAAPWDETLRMVRDGKTDAHAGLFFNDERNKYLEYGSPLVETDTHFFTHRDLPAIDTVEGLTGHKVGVLAGDFVEGFLKKSLTPENIIGFESYEALMAALGDGTLKAFAADTPTGIHHLKKSGLGETFNLPPEPLYRNGWFVAARKGNTSLISIINGGMGLIEVPERRQIAKQWSAGSDRKSADVKPWEGIGDVLTKEERQWLTENPVIRLTPDPAFPPIEFFNDKGNFRGIGAEVTRLMEERLGIRFKIVRAKDWTESTARTQRRENDVWSAVSPTPERQKYMLFTEPYVESPLVIVTRKQIGETLNPEDLRDLKVTYVSDYSGGNWMTINYPGFNYLPAPDTLTALKLVSFGIADAMVVSAALASHYIDRGAITNLRVAGDTGHVLRWGFASRNDWPILNRILQKGLDLVTPEERQAIYRKWAFLEAAPWKLTRQHVIIGLVVLGVLLVIGVLTWNRALQRQINRRIAAQAQAEERLGDAIESISDGFIYYDADERLVLCNQRYKDFYPWISDALVPGAQLKDVARMAALSGQDADTIKDVDDWVRERLSQFREGRHNHVQHLQDGRWLLCSESATQDGGIVGIRTDITERKRAEERLMDAIENVSEGFALFDANKRLVLCNSTYRNIYGYNIQDAVAGVTLGELTQLDLDRGVLDKELGGEEILSRRTKIYGKTQETFDVPLADGRWLQIRDRPTSGGGTVSLHADITTHKRAEDTLRAGKEEAERSAEAKSEFVAMVSHEVRTPMNGVLGMANLLMDMGLNDDQKDCADTIVASGEALLTIIDDLLDVSKLDADKIELEHIPFVAADVIADSMAVMAPQAEEKRLAFTSTIDPVLPAVLIGDSHRLRQVLLNLISNAIKFTDQGSVGVEAAVTTKTDNDVTIAFLVTDTGMGIDQDAQDKLFDDYTQASMEVARKHGGTGLGLSICRRLIGLMGGEISIDSTPGEGSTFSFVAQFAIADAAETAKRLDAAKSSRGKQKNANGSAKSVSRRLRVLQVEDNETNRDVAEKILSKGGHQVTNAGNGVEALEVIETGGFDIVLMDRDMPKMDGIEATRRIRAKSSPIASIPIVGITASAIQSQLDDCLAAGMNVCLTKPVDARQLLATLEQLAAYAPADLKPVLVIDDNEINRTVAAKQLTKLGYPLDLAGGGAEGLDMAEAKNYGMILVDISMPEMDGLEFLKRFRQSEQGCPWQTPVIAMTGHGTPEDRNRFLEAGMDGVLAKPVAIEELAAALRSGVAPTGTSKPEPAAVTTGTGSEHPAIDLQQLSEILGEEDVGELFDMLDFFVDQFPGLLDSLQVAVADRNPRAVRDQAHAAKSAATSAAAVPLSALLQSLETRARDYNEDEDWNDIVVQADAITSEYARIVAFCTERREGP